MMTDESKRIEIVASSSTVTGGDMALAVALIEEGVLARELMNPLLDRLRVERPAAIQNGQTLTLLQLLVSERIAKLDDLLGIVVERSGLPYLPLSTYDIDRDVACLLPQGVSFESCLIPFDRISRSVLIAVVNPLDMAVREQIRELIGCEVFWYVSSPVDITNALRRAYGLDKQTGSGAPKAR